MVKYTGRGLVVERPGVLSKVQMLNLVLGVGVFSLLPIEHKRCQDQDQATGLEMSSTGSLRSGPGDLEGPGVAAHSMELTLETGHSRLSLQQRPSKKGAVS